MVFFLFKSRTFSVLVAGFYLFSKERKYFILFHKNLFFIPFTYINYFSNKQSLPMSIAIPKGINHSCCVIFCQELFLLFPTLENIRLSQWNSLEITFFLAPRHATIDCTFLYVTRNITGRFYKTNP